MMEGGGAETIEMNPQVNPEPVLSDDVKGKLEEAARSAVGRNGNPSIHVGDPNMTDAVLTYLRNYLLHSEISHWPRADNNKSIHTWDLRMKELSPKAVMERIRTDYPDIDSRKSSTYGMLGIIVFPDRDMNLPDRLGTFAFIAAHTPTIIIHEAAPDRLPPPIKALIGERTDMQVTVPVPPQKKDPL